MQKYKVTQKLKKTRHCSYYNAQNLITGEKVTIKKLSANNNWDELLKKKEIMMMKQPHYPFLARIKEIIKENGKFFIVHEQLTQGVDELKKKELTLAEVANISRQMIQIVIHLRREGVVLYELRSEFFFVDRKRVKLAYTVSREEQGDMLEHLDYRYFAPEMNLGFNEQVAEESNVFMLGCITCELLLGKPLISAKSKIDYMYIVCGLFPKQKFEGGGSSVNASSMNLQLAQTFETVMEQKCSSRELIDLLRDMTRINCKFRITLEEALRRMKHLQLKFQTEEKERSSSKRRFGNSMQASSAIDKMNQKVDQISRERQRYRTSPENRVSSEDSGDNQLSIPHPRLISTNHQINIDLQNELYQKISCMPQITRECTPLSIEKNVKDNASFSIVTKQKNLQELIIPVSNNKANKSNLPMIVQPVKQRNAHGEAYDGIPSTTFTQRNIPSTNIRFKAQLTELMNIRPNITGSTQKLENIRTPQLTNYARNNSTHLGVEIAPDDTQIGSEFVGW